VARRGEEGARRAQNGGARFGQADELDEIDKKIIVELQVDGRMPFTKLSKSVGLSEPAVRQRVNRLREKGVMQIVAVTDPMRGGSRLMALVGVTSDGKATNVARALAELEESVYVVATAGSFDVLVEIVCSGPQELLEIVNRIRDIDGVRSTETFMYLDFFKHSFNYGVS
jgi:Lrp/AsnC family transcriptional regulator, regulator for asnA, asnC and gidA